jgi:hypothetical protein
MNALIPLTVTSIVLAGIVVFWFRYGGTRARFPGLAAFGLGLIAIVAVPFTHAIKEPVVSIGEVFFLIHLLMCLVELLLLGTVLSLRDPTNSLYEKAELIVGSCLGAVAVLLYGAVAWWAPQQQNELLRIAYAAMPFSIAIAIIARFGWWPAGLLGAGLFFGLGLNTLVYVIFRLEEKATNALVVIAGVLQILGYVGILAFFFVVARHSELLRTPWPRSSLGMNPARFLSVVLLIACMSVCGYMYQYLSNDTVQSSKCLTCHVTAAVLSAGAFAGCLLSVVGLTIGRNPFVRKSHFAQS